MSADETSDERSGTDSSEGGRTSLIGETLKKVFATGVSAAFMTEESIRSYLGDLKLPKDVLNLVIQGANKSKDEITQRVSREVTNIIQKIDWVKELSRFAETHKFKISAEIDIIKKKSETDPTKSSS